MPRYQFYFDTPAGVVERRVQIEDVEALREVLGDILAQLKDDGHVLVGKGDPVIVHDGRMLDLGGTLSNQGVRPDEVLRVRLMELDMNG